MKRHEQLLHQDLFFFFPFGSLAGTHSARESEGTSHTNGASNSAQLPRGPLANGADGFNPVAASRKPFPKQKDQKGK